MADKPYEAQDPFTLVGVNSLGRMTEDAVEEMGRCFVEELARMGWGRARILHAFRHPFFHGPHLVYQRKGETFVLALLDQAFPDGNRRSARHG